MLSLFSDNRIEYSFKLDGKDLNVAVDWLPDQDQLIMNALIRAMFGKVVDTATSTVASLTPSTGSVETVPMQMPEVMLELDPEQVRSQLGPEIQAHLFPGQYWDGKEPRMTVDVDTIPFANNALAEITYRVLTVTSKDGRDLLRRSDQVIEHTIRPGEPVPGFVAIDVKPGTPAESLETADIRFDFKVPTRLNELEFSLADPLETTRVAGDIPVRLMRLEKDVVEIGFKDNSGIFMFAFDRSGLALKVSESTQSSRRIARRYHGRIHHIKVLVVEKQLVVPIELSVNLNGGQPYTLSHRPETPTWKRFDHSALKTYQDFNAGRIDQLKVQWHEASESERHDRLSVTLPHAPFHAQTEWDVHFFGPQSPVDLAGHPTHSWSRMNYTLKKGALRTVNAVTGQLRMRLGTNIQRQQFVKISDKTPVIQKLPSGKIVTVIFDRNEVTLTPFDDATAQIIAYDADNRRLRRDAYAQTMGLMRKYYYWGIPARVEVDIAGNQIKKSIDFDIVKRPVNQKAYDAFRQRLSCQKEVVAALKQIQAARKQDRNRYGDDLAGLYYVYARKKKAPMQLIDEAVAHADPAGEKRFGYRLQPHRGYYFTVLAGKESNGSRQEFPRNKRTISVNWKEGVIKATNYRQLPTIAAIPVDQSQPTFFVHSGKVFMKSLNGEVLKYLPDDPLNSGWVEVGIPGG
jgi:hypothetical protein